MIKKNNRKINAKIIVTWMFFITILLFNTIYADGFFSPAMNFWNNGRLDPTMQTSMNDIINEISGYIRITGTVVIVIATIVMGIRYIFGSVSQKAMDKENLFGLLVACILFFGWSNIQKILFTGKDFILWNNTNSYNDAVVRVFYIFKFIAQIVAFGAILYVGIKYIFAGAEGKAQLKGKSGLFILGIIMTFATFELLDFVSDIIIQATN